jgi:hypothetical protein
LSSAGRLELASAAARSPPPALAFGAADEEDDCIELHAASDVARTTVHKHLSMFVFMVGSPYSTAAFFDSMRPSRE